MKKIRIHILIVLVIAAFAALGGSDNTAAGENTPQPAGDEPGQAPDDEPADEPGEEPQGDAEAEKPAEDDMIFDHNDTDIAKISLDEINTAKQTLHIAYGHTSHGSQLTTGMTGLVKFADNGGKGLKHPAGTFAWNDGGANGALDLHDRAMSRDLGHRGDTSWADRTRKYLSAHEDVNVIIWSWCGGCSDNTAEGVNKYLDAMTALEKEYPKVIFVYMTGHLDHGRDANLKMINKIIRDYCVGNDKALYDYADIESYDPDGKFFEFSHDNCDYYESAKGKKLGNWADEWQAAHTEGVDWYRCASAHSRPLNANQKAYAAWALWVRIAKKLSADD